MITYHRPILEYICKNTKNNIEDMKICFMNLKEYLEDLDIFIVLLNYVLMVLIKILLLIKLIFLLFLVKEKNDNSSKMLYVEK